MTTDQGAREARYAEAIWGHANTRSAARAVMAVADAEVAAAVSEAQAEVQRLGADRREWMRAAIVADDEVERLRADIRALADTIPADLFMLRRALRALLTPSPAATTGEACVRAGEQTWCNTHQSLWWASRKVCDEAIAAPVSSGEAARG